jgi:hypothetical protein
VLLWRIACCARTRLSRLSHAERFDRRVVPAQPVDRTGQVVMAATVVHRGNFSRRGNISRTAQRTGRPMEATGHMDRRAPDRMRGRSTCPIRKPVTWPRRDQVRARMVRMPGRKARQLTNGPRAAVSAPVERSRARVGPAAPSLKNWPRPSSSGLESRDAIAHSRLSLTSKSNKISAPFCRASRPFPGVTALRAGRRRQFLADAAGFPSTSFDADARGPGASAGAPPVR